MLACTPPTSTLKGSIEPCPLATSSSPSREGRPASSTTRSAGSSRPAGGIPGPFGTIYAGHFGIEGVLKEELLDLSATPEEEVALLRTSPAAGGIGTCRYKLKKGQDLDFERVVEVLRAHDIGYFFYIGGNDSQDTAHKVSKLGTRARARPGGHRSAQDHRQRPGRPRVHVARPFARLRLGRPLLCPLHSPGQRGEPGLMPADPVLVIQAMGRKIGFIPAAARLADPERNDADPDLPDRVRTDPRAARRERASPARDRRPVHRRRQRGLRRGRLWERSATTSATSSSAPASRRSPRSS